MNKIQIIADSKNEHGQRLISAIATFPRYLLAEVNTHRMLSRNSASSRAIRFEKMVQSVQENPFIPFRWQKDHSGMQGTEYFSDEGKEAGSHKYFTELWLEARNAAVSKASLMNKQGLTKQLCNRLLEPYMYHTALISGTELENFFSLRAQDAAEIHFQDLAYKFLDAVNESEPKQLKASEWHIPFGDGIDEDLLYTAAYNHHGDHATFKFDESWKVKIATVRCARISYLVSGGEQKFDYAADLALHDRLASSGHWSAFEHCAKAMTRTELGRNFVSSDITRVDTSRAEGYSYGWCGNFRGFVQYRKMFSDENRSDLRLIRK